MSKILVLGGRGLLGSDVARLLSEQKGEDAVVSADVTPIVATPGVRQVILNCMNFIALRRFVVLEKVTEIYMLAAPRWDSLNVTSPADWRHSTDMLRNVLKVAKECGVSKVFWPSSLEAFGLDDATVEVSAGAELMKPRMHGFMMLAGEYWCNLHREQQDLDIRVLRLPGVISWKSTPGSRPQDYAAALIHEALKTGRFTSPLEAGQRLPFLYQDDAVRAIVELMAAPAQSMNDKGTYMLGGFSVTPQELAAEVKRHIPWLQVTYAPGPAQELAKTWPGVIDDVDARKDWGWSHRFGLQQMVAEMLRGLHFTTFDQV